MYAIGIDIGTTSICGVVIDADTGEVVCSRTEQNDTFVKTENSWEKIQNVEKIITSAKKILKGFEKYPTAVIGLTGQMHGIVYVDAQGKAVSPLYTWQDSRGNLPYKGMTYAEYLGSCSGYGNVTDFYNQIHGIRPKEAVSYCTIMDYLGMVLCGLKKPYIHITNAASLGCFDLCSKKFSYQTEIDLCDGYQLLGHYHGIPVSAAIGDNQASVFSTLSDEEDILLNIGTGSQVSVISDKIKNGENIETRPYFEGKYLIVGSALCGGRAYRILKDFYQSVLEAAGVNDVDAYGLMAKMLLQEMEADREDALEVDSRFAGTRKEPSIRGTIQGISVDNFTPQNLTKGFLRGMVKELYSMYEGMGEKKKNLVGSGNAIRKNRALVEISEQVFEGHLKIPCHREEAAYGAALYGLLANKNFKNASQVQKIIKYE